MQPEDCRIYSQFVKLQFLYSLTIFMKCESEQAQIITLFLINELNKLNGFLIVQAPGVTIQYKIPVPALHEKNKFSEVS